MMSGHLARLVMVSFCVAVAGDTTNACPLYLAPSLMKGSGKGIFVGTRVKVGKRVGQSEGLVIDDYIVQDLALMDYVFESHFDFHSTIFFGPALMLNHAPEKQSTVVKKWNRGVVPSLDSVALRPFTNYPGVSFEARSTLKPGSEITFRYGNKAYFLERNVSFNFVPEDGNNDAPRVDKPLAYTAEELETVGHCLSDIFVNKSTIPMAGKGVFSKKVYDINSTVSVSPVLVVPKHVLGKAGRSSVVMNFCFSDQGTDLALLPLGSAALINHGDEPNVAVRWNSWPGDELSGEASAHDVLSGNLTSLLRPAAAPLYFEYFSLRAIAPGDELFMDYGREWRDAWSQHKRAMGTWADAQQQEETNVLAAPQFRHTVALPRGMLPDSVYEVSCFGTRDCEDYYRIRQPIFLHRKLDDQVGSAHKFNADNIAHALNELNDSGDCNASGVVSVEGDWVKVNSGDGTESESSSQQEDDGQSTCHLYLAPPFPSDGDSNSEVGSSRRAMRVFSGVRYQRGDVLDVSPSVLVSSQALSALRHIGAPSLRENYFTVLFGPGAGVRPSSLFNIDRTYDAEDRLRSVPCPQAQALRPYNIYTDMLYYASDTIEEGSELTVFSGKTTQEPQVQHTDRYSLKELEAVGHCLTDIYLNKSTVRLAGRGVFSKRPHAVGSVVSVSPAAVVSRHVLEEEGSSVLINSCLSERGLDLCVLPLGLASFSNHATEPNMALRWHDPAAAEEVLGGQVGMKDLLAGATPLYLEYYAIRPIAAHEELTVSYGTDWSSAWVQYMSVLVSWMKSKERIQGNSSNVDAVNAPQFRCHISAPVGMFPSSLHQQPPCLGDMGCSGPDRMRRPLRIESNLNREEHTCNLFQNRTGETNRKRSAGEQEIAANESFWTSLLRIFAL